MSFSQKVPTLSRHDTEKHGFVLEKSGKDNSAGQNVSRNQNSTHNSVNNTTMNSVHYHPSSYSMWTKGRRSINKSSTGMKPSQSSSTVVAPVSNVGMKGKVLLFFIVAILLTLLMIAKVAFSTAPICTSLTVLLLIVLCLFVFTEKNKRFFFHHRLSREQAFWTVWVSLLTATLIFSPDSWLNSWFHSRPWQGVFVIVMVVVLWGDYEVQTTMNTLRQPQTVVPVDDLRDAPDSVDARELVASLTSTLQSLSSSSLFRRETQRGFSTVEAVFRAADTLTLNFLIQKVGMSWLLHVIGDFTRVIVEILVSERLHELDVVSKACIIDALQSLRLTSFDRSGHWVSNIFLSTEGIHLTQLKCLLDTKGNVQSLHKQQYQDLGGSFAEKNAIREAILKHITEQAMKVQSATNAHIPQPLKLNEMQQKYSSFEGMSNSCPTTPDVIVMAEPVLAPPPSQTSKGSLFGHTMIVPESSSCSSSSSSDEEDLEFEPTPLDSLLSPPTAVLAPKVVKQVPDDSSDDSSNDEQEKKPLLQVIPKTTVTNNNSQIASNASSPATLARWRGGLDVTPHLSPADPTTAKPRGSQPLQLQQQQRRMSANDLASGPLVKILSDVDDTLFSSGGKFPNGIDRMYRYHEQYPGVICFLKEVDLGFDAVGEWSKAHGRGNVAFQSARPHVYKDKAERKSYQTFERLRKQHGLHAVPTLLPGSLDAGISMLAGDYKPLAQQKYGNFREFISLYPEFSFVFIGDNGQADVLAAELMLENHGSSVARCLIHLVQPIELTPGYTYERCKRWRELGIVFFHTYIGAAVYCCQARLVHPRAVRRIIRAAQIDFAAIHQEDFFSDWTAVKAAAAGASTDKSEEGKLDMHQPQLREAHRTQQNGDILLARKQLSHPQMLLDEQVAMVHNPELTAADDISQLELIPAIRAIPNGVVVSTTPDFGLQTVCGFDSALNVYTLRLLARRPNKAFMLPVLSGKKSKRGVVPPLTAKLHPTVLSEPCNSTSGNDSYMPPLSDSNTYATTIYAHESNISIAVRPNIGARVVTLFGTGVITSYDQCGFHVVSIRDIDRHQIAECHLKACDFDFIAAAKGDVVRTVYGAGLVIDYRVKDRVYVVALPWGTAYLNPDSILGFEDSGKSTCVVM